MRKGWRWLAMVAVLGIACMQAAAADDPALALLQRAAGANRVVLLGELHGTEETPRLAGEYVASSARTGPVILALEIDRRQQPLISRYLASDGSAGARVALLSGEHWQDPMHDGRDSIAMFDLIERMRSLRADGTPVAVLAFDPAGGDMDARNRGMARILRKAASLAPDARLVVLTGNVHAMTQPGGLFLDGRRIVPATAGRALADLGPVSVDIRGAAGEAWACTPDCAKHPATPSPRELAMPTLERNAPGSGWDYTLVLPRLTVSSPAIEAADGGSTGD